MQAGGGTPGAVEVVVEVEVVGGRECRQARAGHRCRWAIPWCSREVERMGGPLHGLKAYLGGHPSPLTPPRPGSRVDVTRPNHPASAIMLEWVMQHIYGLSYKPHQPDCRPVRRRAAVAVLVLLAPGSPACRARRWELNARLQAAPGGWPSPAGQRKQYVYLQLTQPGLAASPLPHRVARTRTPPHLELICPARDISGHSHSHSACNLGPRALRFADR